AYCVHPSKPQDQLFRRSLPALRQKAPAKSSGFRGFFALRANTRRVALPRSRPFILWTGRASQRILCACASQAKRPT
ncbi:hypothetical protein, partial [Achromobacter ruhlandii]|uniref:hypothetical protein n=1 Tax=Achromobacter ruhlandii TaxID=72557 RepID=UPI003B9CBA8C